MEWNWFKESNSFQTAVLEPIWTQRSGAHPERFLWDAGEAIETTDPLAKAVAELHEFLGEQDWKRFWEGTVAR
jgi:hypothetical protein